MRTIKFRAKQQSGHNWVYGSLLTDAEDNYTIICTSECVIEPLYRVLVDEDTIGQFTGITAIDGAEIYEGDTIREIEGKRTFVVEYSDDYAAFIGYNEFDWIILHKGAQYRVIGNIYDRDETETI
jgi:uncharacterized phage protein (TIGR01671 family)